MSLKRIKEHMIDPTFVQKVNNHSNEIGLLSEEIVRKPNMSQQATEPTGAAEGDFWLDTSDDTFQGTKFQELNTTVQDHTSQLAETQSKFDTQFVNLKNPQPPLVGAKGDGVTDDYQAITNLFNYCDVNGLGLFVPASLYLTSQTLIYNGKFPIIGVRGHSVIKATAAMTYVFVIDKDNNDIYRNNSFRTGEITGLTVNGNSLADTTLYIKRGKGITLRGCEFTRPLINAGLVSGEASMLVWELVMDDVIFNATNDTGQAQYALRIRQMSDCWFSKLLLINGSVNWLKIDGGAASSFKSVHAYAYPETLAPDTGIDVFSSGGIKMDDIYCDTTKRVGMNVQGNAATLNLITTSLKMGYIDEGTGDICSVKISGTNHKVNNVEIGIPDSAKQARTSVVVFDNTTPQYDFSCGYLSGGSGTSLNTDLKIIGKVPTRFRFEGGTQSTESFKDKNVRFLNQVIYTTDSSKSFTFKNERLSAVYKVDVETNWNTNWWVTNKTTTGFTVNFPSPPASNGTINVEVSI